VVEKLDPLVPAESEIMAMMVQKLKLSSSAFTICANLTLASAGGAQHWSRRSVTRSPNTLST
jgi:hypothetical protein